MGNLWKDDTYIVSSQEFYNVLNKCVHGSNPPSHIVTIELSRKKKELNFKN